MRTSVDAAIGIWLRRRPPQGTVEALSQQVTSSFFDGDSSQLWYLSTLHLGDVMGYRYSLIAKVFE